jgi:hypothetical protein
LCEPVALTINEPGGGSIGFPKYLMTKLINYIQSAERMCKILDKKDAVSQLSSLTISNASGGWRLSLILTTVRQPVSLTEPPQPLKTSNNPLEETILLTPACGFVHLLATLADSDFKRGD